MKEARIILPVKDNEGKSLEAVRKRLVWWLATHFGGFTEFKGRGAWSGPDGRIYDEPVYIYDVAVSDDAAVADQFRSFARWLAKEARQEAIYLRLPSGQVEFITA